MTHKSSSLFQISLIIVGAILLVGLIQLDSPAWWFVLPRLLLGCIYMLYLPGMALRVLLFSAEKSLDSAENLGLDIGLSIAWIPILSLILHYTKLELRTLSILTTQFSLITLGLIRLYRQNLAFNRPTFAWRTYLPILIALPCLILLVTWAFLRPTPADFYTEFYLLNANSDAQIYLEDSAEGESMSMMVGITNQEQISQTYHVEVWVQDRWQRTLREQVVMSNPIPLSPQSTSEMMLSWQMPRNGNDQKVEFLLFNNDKVDPYRRLHLWIDVTND